VAPHQKKLAYQSIEAGADMVLGHHPHRLQGLEIYKGSLICYSLGNIVFDTVFSFHQNTMIVETLISNKKIEKAYLYPLLSAKSESGLFGPVLPSERDFKKIVIEIERLSQNFGTKFIRNEDRVEVVLS
jgi:poly-gamma-glutamate synthesis protein (capsule biosynthesis protein)